MGWGLGWGRWVGGNQDDKLQVHHNGQGDTTAAGTGFVEVMSRGRGTEEQILSRETSMHIPAPDPKVQLFCPDATKEARINVHTLLPPGKK